jgi:hypothetical protein
MKRVKRITAKDDFTDVKVTIEIKSKLGWRSRKEMESFSSNVASGIMHQLSSTVHLKTTLDKIKVS